MGALQREEEHKQIVESALEKLRLDRENRLKHRYGHNVNVGANNANVNNNIGNNVNNGINGVGISNAAALGKY